MCVCDAGSAMCVSAGSGGGGEIVRTLLGNQCEYLDSLLTLLAKSGN